MSFSEAIDDAFQKSSDSAAKSFDEIRRRVSRGCSPTQFLIYRDNYVYRTRLTIGSIARTVAVAADAADYETLKLIGSNLVDELGGTTKQPSHIELLVESHNLHSDVVFGLPRLSLDRRQAGSIYASAVIFPETRKYESIVSEVYRSLNYIEVLSASFAQETAAQKMLETFYNAFFVPYAGRYKSRAEFAKVAEYFLCHIGGLEAQHAQNAKACVLKNCRTLADEEQAIMSIRTFTAAQQAIWDRLAEALRE